MTLTLTLTIGQSTLVYWPPYSSHTSHHPSQTPCLSWISYATQKLMLDSCKMVEKQSEAFYTFLCSFFPSLKQNFISNRSSKVSSRPDCIFEIHQLWQSGFSRVYSNSCCSCSFEPEIIKVGQSSHKMYSNNLLNFQESTPISNACTKKSGSILKSPYFLSHSIPKGWTQDKRKVNYVVLILIILWIITQF